MIPTANDNILEAMRATKREMKARYLSCGMPWRQGIDKWELQGFPKWWDEVE